MHRLRICHIASGDLWAGAEVQIAGLLRSLQHFPDLELSAVLLNKGRLAEELSALGIPVTIYDEASLTSWGILQSLCSYFQEQRPHIIHTHRYKENILGSLAAKFSPHPVVIQTVHGLQERLGGWKRVKLGVYSWGNRMVTRWTAQGIIGVSQEMSAVLQRTFPRTQVVYIPNGIDRRRVIPAVRAEVKRKELDIPAEALVIGTVCRLTPIKGIEYLLTAVSQLAKERELGEIRVLIAGDGPLRSELEDLATALDIGHKTLFLGMRADVYDLMSLFDIYVLPSLHEGIPMALLEAMTLGCPVVASRVGGIPEMINDGIEGRLVPPQDVPALREAIRELLLSNTLRKEMGQAAQKRISQDYDGQRMAGRVRELYWSIVRSSK